MNAAPVVWSSGRATTLPGARFAKSCITPSRANDVRIASGGTGGEHVRSPSIGRRQVVAALRVAGLVALTALLVVRFGHFENKGDLALEFATEEGSSANAG